ncbi:PIN domain-containing protein [Achromobacter xylosoxidans]
MLDTNVLLHDPSSLFRFEEHDIFLPMMTLEELDHQKKACRKWRAMPARSAARSTRWCRTRPNSKTAWSWPSWATRTPPGA